MGRNMNGVKNRSANMRMARLAKRLKRSQQPPAPRRKPKPQRPHVTKGAFVKAARGSCGNRGWIAKRLGVAPTSIYRLLEREDWEDMRKVVAEEEDEMIDLSQSALRDAIEQRLDMGTASRTAQWYLQRKAKHLGFGEESKVVHEGGDNPLQVQTNTIPIEALGLPIEIRRLILEAIEKKEADAKSNES